jgi:hypothetical protein
MQFWNIVFLLSCITRGMRFSKMPRLPSISSKTQKGVKQDIQVPVTYPIDERISDVQGFFGMIGPDVNISSLKNIFDMLVGDGMIQGIFFDRGNLTFVRHHIRTEKHIYEETHGSLNSDPSTIIPYIIMNKMKLLPNMIGVANTAFIQMHNSTYALFERDLPYKIDIDLDKKQITTVGRVNITNLSYMSGHTKQIDTNRLRTLEYHVLEKTVNIIDMDSEFRILKTYSVKTKYLPIVHDFITTNRGTVLFSDTPFLPFVSGGKFPIQFCNSLPTYIHTANSTDGTIDTYSLDQAFYIFHFAKAVENDTHIDIFAPMYDHVNFSDLIIDGKYRKISICKPTKSVVIQRNPFLEMLNLDFPVLFHDFVILRNIYQRRINGFVICQGIDIVDTIFFDELNICGEPTIMYANGTAYLTAFAFRKEENQGYLLMIRLFENGTFDRDFIKIQLPERVQIGFHSGNLRSSELLP